MKTYRTFSSNETRAIASRLAEDLLRRSRRKSLVVALEGELGAGKTTFVQGFLKGLGGTGRALSPTFILVRKTRLRMRRFKNFFHVDAYRLKGKPGVLGEWLKETLADPKNIVLVEWADMIRKIVPRHAVWLRFKHGRTEKERSITIQ